MERAFERPTIQRSHAAHELNVARRIEGGPEYRLELDPGFRGTILLFLHGTSDDTVTVLADIQYVRVYVLMNGDVVAHIEHEWDGGYVSDDSYSELISRLSRGVESMEAYPVISTSTSF